MSITKTVVKDGEKYQIKLKHNPMTFSPYGFNLTVSYKGTVVHDEYHKNLGNFTFKEVVQRVVKEVHLDLYNERRRKEALIKFENELKDWDGVI